MGVGNFRVTMYSALPHGLVNPGRDVGTLIRYHGPDAELVYWRKASICNGLVIIGFRESAFKNAKYRGQKQWLDLMITGYASWLANAAEEIKEINGCSVTSHNVETIALLLYEAQQKRSRELVCAVDFRLREMGHLGTYRLYTIDSGGHEAEIEIH